MTHYHHQDNEAMLNTLLAMSSRRHKKSLAGVFGMITMVGGATAVAVLLGSLFGF